MASRTLISVEEYLRTSYRPDCDYVDGEVLERNVGETDHSWLQKKIILYLGIREQQLGICVLPEERVQVKADRYRVPDICLVLGTKPEEQVLSKPPFLCIEILSPEDRMSRIRERTDDYLVMGVPYIWVLDPIAQRAWSVTPAEGLREVMDGILRTQSPSIEVPLAELFS